MCVQRVCGWGCERERAAESDGECMWRSRMKVWQWSFQQLSGLFRKVLCNYIHAQYVLCVGHQLLEGHQWQWSSCMRETLTHTLGVNIKWLHMDRICDRFDLSMEPCLFSDILSIKVISCDLVTNRMLDVNCGEFCWLSLRLFEVRVVSNFLPVILYVFIVQFTLDVVENMECRTE